MTLRHCTTVFLAVGMTAITLGAADRAAADDSNNPKTRWGTFDAGQYRNDSRACVRSKHHLDRNVRNAIGYYTLAFNAGEPELAVEKYIGVDSDGNKTYTQHNPFAADGPQAFIDFVNFFKGLYPELNVNIVRTIAQCDLVMTHAHITTGPDDLGNAAMDIFRFDAEGKIVEHWDAVQAVEANPLNDNTQF